MGKLVVVAVVAMEKEGGEKGEGERGQQDGEYDCGWGLSHTDFNMTTG